MASMISYSLPCINGKYYDQSDADAIFNVLGQGQIGQIAFLRCAEMFFKDRPDCKVLIPRSPLEHLKTLQKVIETAPKYLCVPLILTKKSYFFESRHIVHLLVEKTDEKVSSIEFFDSRGSSIQDDGDVSALVEAIKGPDCQVVENKKVLQGFFDFYHCGAYVLCYLEQRLIKETSLAEICAPEEGIKQYRIDLADRLAKNCVLQDLI